MGLSTLPSPSDGLMYIVLFNTAITISVVRYILRAFLHVIGIRWEDQAMASGEYEISTAEAYGNGHITSTTATNFYVEEFKYQTPTLRYGELDQDHHEAQQDCCVCLAQFEPESEINHLPCGHVFHKDCLEKWVDHWNITCPLCRTPMMDGPCC
ncbi:hypothetical protein Dimus_009783 [Dionaea muscipula]